MSCVTLLVTGSELEVLKFTSQGLKKVAEGPPCAHISKSAYCRC